MFKNCLPGLILGSIGEGFYPISEGIFCFKNGRTGRLFYIWKLGAEENTVSNRILSELNITLEGWALPYFLRASRFWELTFESWRYFVLQVAFHRMVANPVGTKPANRVICFIFNHLGNGATPEPCVTGTVVNSPSLMTRALCKTSLIREENWTLMTVTCTLGWVGSWIGFGWMGVLCPIIHLNSGVQTSLVVTANAGHYWMPLDGIQTGEGMDGDGMIYHVPAERDTSVNSC